jgi:hypothetical protein
LIATLSGLFKAINETKQIPDQWKVAKVNPIPKRGQIMRFPITDQYLTFAQHQRF